MKNIILASTSKRRKIIFSKLGLPFKCVKPDYEEDNTIPLKPKKLVEYIARNKAQSVIKKHKDSIVIAVDTLVFYKDEVFAKPKNKQDALEMLQKLNGTTHKVISGYCIIDTATMKEITGTVTTEIIFKANQPSVLKKYIDSGEAENFAGAYNHEELGAILVKEIKGDFFNSIGMPLSEISDKLKGFGVYPL